MINSTYFKKWFRKKDLIDGQEAMSHDDEDSQTDLKKDAIIGRMTAFFAHEIRNPLTTIVGFSQHLEKNSTIKNDPNLSVYVSIIKEEALRMEQLIQELLNLSKAHYSNDNVTIIDVKLSIDKIVTIYTKKAAEKNITFKAELVDNVFIRGNIDRFESVLINLIVNAIEAIERDGKIEIHMKKGNNFVTITITDSGPGISDEDLEQIFYPFYTTKSNGTGIGLAICQTIIESLGGTINIYNVSSGARVKIKLPLSKQTP